MDGERAEYNIYSEVQIHTIIDFYLNLLASKSNMKARELRNECISCRPCSLNFVDKILREVLDFCVAHLLRLSFPFCLLP